jgi:predicted branched-subunit amino acid permease
MQSERLEAIQDGLKASSVLVMGILPFGIICGAAAAQAGFTGSQSFALSWMVFAGSAQIISAQLFAENAPFWVIVATAWIVNLRFLMYSAGLANHLRSDLRELSRPVRWVWAYLLTDHGFLLTMTKPGRKNRGYYYLGISISIWLMWQVSNLIGIAIGNIIPANLSLDFVVAVTFIAIIAPALNNIRTISAAVAGGLTAVCCQFPFKLSVLAAACTGVVAGLVAEKIWPADK